ncbi:MAG: hypothetical protein DSY37_02760 [Hyperthermus sp.]|nr:MAG: hypothetical protein DSY37_02760 [Hyperthermus sp.]
MQRKDFLRHIVNRVLASSGAPRQLIDEIRQQVGKAEDKYKFHAFGGNVRRLAEYLNSSDFDQLLLYVKAEKTGKGREVMKRILDETLKAYMDLDEVVRAVKKRLEELEGETVEAQGARALGLEELLDMLRERGFMVAREGERVTIRRGDNFTVEVERGQEGFHVSFRVSGERRFSSRDDVSRFVRSLASLA